MTTLWIAIGVLTLIAVSVVFLPVLRAQKVQRSLATRKERQQQNIEIFRERLAELEQEREQGTLDDESFAQLKLELERNLLADADPEADKHALSRKPVGVPQLVTVTLLALMVPVAAFGLYDQLGRHQDLAIAMNPPPVPKTLDEAIDQLKAELDRHPENPEGWYLLAQTLMNQGKFDEGLAAYQKVGELLPEQAPQYATVQGQIAQAMYYAQGRQMTPAVEAQIHKTLTIDPLEVTTLGLQGIDAFEHEDYENAIKHWAQGLEKASPEAARSLRQGIAEAKQRLQAQGKSVPELPQMAQLPVINVHVSLSENLQKQVKPDQTLFIYAKSPNAPVPIVAVKKQVSDLPLTLTLDNSMAMVAGRELSADAEVDLGARISTTGAVTAAAGDLTGIVSGVKVGTDKSAPIELVIDKVAQ